MCSRRVSSSCSTNDNRRITKAVISHEGGKDSEECSRRVEHIRSHLWHRYSATVNQVMVGTVKLSKWWSQLNNIIVATAYEKYFMKDWLQMFHKYHNHLFANNIGAWLDEWIRDIWPLTTSRMPLTLVRSLLPIVHGIYQISRVSSVSSVFLSGLSFSHLIW
jgi:hypothetical protein